MTIRYFLLLIVLVVVVGGRALAIEGSPGGSVAPVVPWPAVNDNPRQTSCVIVICGSAKERTLWRDQARTHYGARAHLITDINSLDELGTRLANRFPNNSIELLVIGAHGWNTGPMIGPERLNDRTLAANASTVTKLQRVLSEFALVDLQCCGAANDTDGRRSCQEMANILRSRVRGATSTIGPWEDNSSPYMIFRPRNLAGPVPPPLAQQDPPGVVRPPEGGIGLIGVESGDATIPPHRPRGEDVPPVRPPPAVVSPPALDPPVNPQPPQSEPSVDPAPRGRKTPASNVDRNALPRQYRGAQYTETVSTDGHWVEVRHAQGGGLVAHIPVEEIINGIYRDLPPLAPDSVIPPEHLPRRYRTNNYVARVSVNGRWIQILEQGSNQFVAQIPVEEIRRGQYRNE